MGTYADNENLDLYDEDVEDEDTLEELDVDENGHVIEGRRRKRRSRDDEYEPDFGEQENEPERYDEEYEEPEDSYEEPEDSYD